jgi:predicted DNA-binding transcriptional regulator AlpA
MNTINVPLIIRRSQLKSVLGISPSTVDRLETHGRFPKKRRWSSGVVGHLGSEVQKWSEEQGEVI